MFRQNAFVFSNSFVQLGVFRFGILKEFGIFGQFKYFSVNVGLFDFGILGTHACFVGSEDHEVGIIFVVGNIGIGGSGGCE
jgi:hypothetical protein